MLNQGVLVVEVLEATGQVLAVYSAQLDTQFQ
jgi:hypothetical protein